MAFIGCCANLKSITVEEGNTKYASDNGALYDRHKTVLLTAHTDGFDLGRTGSGLFHRPLDALGHGGDPIRRILLLSTGRQTGDQIIRFACRRQNFSGLSVYN